MPLLPTLALLALGLLLVALALMPRLKLLPPQLMPLALSLLVPRVNQVLATSLALKEAALQEALELPTLDACIAKPRQCQWLH